MFKNTGTFDVITFVNDWNQDMSVKDLAAKHKLSPSIVRSRVTALRKKGVNIKSRSRVGIVSLSESEVEKINRSIVKL